MTMPEPCARLPQFNDRKTGGMDIDDCIKKHKLPGPGCVDCPDYPKEWSG
jgi:hypothetical protein